LVTTGLHLQSSWRRRRQRIDVHVTIGPTNVVTSATLAADISRKLEDRKLATTLNRSAGGKQMSRVADNKPGRIVNALDHLDSTFRQLRSSPLWERGWEGIIGA
jgi:hypothetical protein